VKSTNEIIRDFHAQFPDAQHQANVFAHALCVYGCGYFDLSVLYRSPYDLTGHPPAGAADCYRDHCKQSIFKIE